MGRAKTAQTFCTRAMASGGAQKRKRSLQRKRLIRPARCTSSSRYFLKRAVRSSGEKPKSARKNGSGDVDAIFCAHETGALWVAGIICTQERPATRKGDWVGE